MCNWGLTDNFKVLFNIITFHSYISGMYFGCFVIILVEINVKVFLWKCAKRLLYMVKITSSERYWTLLTKETSQG